MKQILMMMVAVVLVGCGTTKVDLDASEPSSEPSIGIVTANGSARGKTTIFTPPIFRLKQGELLNILEEVTLDKPKSGEPRKWYRVQIPVDRKEEVQRRIRPSSPAGPKNGFAYVPALFVTRQSKATTPPQDKP